jgi:5-methylcytosine-specific restriction endonuclease McrA
MRSISLKDIIGKSIDDDAIFVALAPKIGLHHVTRARVLSAYAKYRKSKGNSSTRKLGLAAQWPKKFSDLYEGRAKKYGLEWIETIATTAKYGYCSMCGAETHKTVDHFLPRSPWAEFSFFSLNLVPSCGTCNNKRGNRANAPGTSPRLLHPYFDGKLLGKRLHITRIEGPYEAPMFKPDVRRSLKRLESKRVRRHLNTSIDLVVYQQFCSNRWSELKQEIKRLKTLEEVSNRLATLLMDSVSTSGQNSWKTAFYAGVSRAPDLITWLFNNKTTF